MIEVAQVVRGTHEAQNSSDRFGLVADRPLPAIHRPAKLLRMQSVVPPFATTARFGTVGIQQRRMKWAFVTASPKANTS